MPKNVIGSSNSTTFLGSTDWKLYASNLNETGSTSTNLSAKGLSLVAYSSVANTFTLSPPETGVEKIIAMDSTKVADSTSIAISIYSGSTAILFRDNTTTYTEKLYINMLPPYAGVKLVGLSTSKWGVLGTHGAVQFSTAAGYTT